MPKTSILMVTYAKDFEFARYAFYSTTKFATGFHEKIVVVPDRDVQLFLPEARKHGFEVVGFAERSGAGMLHHMVKILEADELCSGDYILHMDADCLFTKPTTPDVYFRDGKVELWREAYEDFKDYAVRYSWKKCVRDAIGIDPVWETMCRHPNVHYRGVYAYTRTLIQTMHGDWREYILRCRNEFPQTFAEYPTLGTVALECYAERYLPVTIGVTGRTPELVREHHMTAHWSHAGIDEPCQYHDDSKPARVLIHRLLGLERDARI